MKKRGFTLIEVIAALVLLAVLAGLFVPVFNSGVLGSVSSGNQLQAAVQLRSEMEQWVVWARRDYTGAAFANLSAAVNAHFNGIPEISVAENQWVEFQDNGATLVENPSVGGETRHLRLTLAHARGPRLTFILSRVE